MQKSIDYTIPYREAGEAKLFRVKVSFISNWVIKRYDEMQSRILEVDANWKEIQRLGEQIVDLKRNKAEGYKDEVDELKERIEKLSDDIKAFSNGDFFQTRYELVKQILQDNGIRDAKYLSYEFWDRQVDASVLMDMLLSVVYKDVNQSAKKKRGRL